MKFCDLIVDFTLRGDIIECYFHPGSDQTYVKKYRENVTVDRHPYLSTLVVID